MSVSMTMNGAVLPVDGGGAIVDVASIAFEVERSDTT
jgi:hypothetical protein